MGLLLNPSIKRFFKKPKRDLRSSTSDQAKFNESQHRPAGVYLNLNQLIEWVLQSPRFKIQPNARSLARSGGQYQSRMRGRGMDFSEVRQYEPGDDVRNIDWRVTARTSKPHTKVFEEERERPLYLVVDQSPSLFFGSQHLFKSLYVSHLAALLGFRTINQGDRLGGIVFNHERIQDIAARRGKGAWQGLCHHLLEFNHQLNAQLLNQAASPWTDILSHLLALVRPGSLVIFISDFYTPMAPAKTMFNRLNQNNDVVFVSVSDPLEQRLPEQLAQYTNGGKKISINGRDSEIQQHFENHFTQRRADLSHFCKTSATGLINLSTEDDAYSIAAYFDPKFSH